MSTYATSEQALLDTIRLMPEYTSTNSSRGDFGVWDAAGSSVGVVVIKGGRSQMGDRLEGGRATHGKRQQRHRIAVVVGLKRGQANDSTAYVTLIAATEAIIAHLDRYQRLQATVKRAEASEATEVQRRRDNPFIFCTILVDIMTETENSYASGESPQ